MTLKDILDLISEKSKELQKLIDLYNKEMDSMKNSPIVKLVGNIINKVCEVSDKKEMEKEKDNENNKS